MGKGVNERRSGSEEEGWGRGFKISYIDLRTAFRGWWGWGSGSELGVEGRGMGVGFGNWGLEAGGWGWHGWSKNLRWRKSS